MHARALGPQTTKQILDQIFGRGPTRQKLQWMTYDELQRQEAKVAAQPVVPGQEREHEQTVQMLLNATGPLAAAGGGTNAASLDLLK